MASAADDVRIKRKLKTDIEAIQNGCPNRGKFKKKGLTSFLGFNLTGIFLLQF